MTYISKKCALFVNTTFNYQSGCTQKNNLNQFMNNNELLKVTS